MSNPKEAMKCLSIVSYIPGPPLQLLDLIIDFLPFGPDFDRIQTGNGPVRYACSLCGGKPTRDITGHVKLQTHQANVAFEERHVAQNPAGSGHIGWAPDESGFFFDHPEVPNQTELFNMDLDAEVILDEFSDGEVSVTGSEMFGSLFDSACESEDKKASMDIDSLLEQALDGEFHDSQNQENETDFDSMHQPSFAADLNPSESDDWYPFKNKEVSSYLALCSLRLQR